MIFLVMIKKVYAEVRNVILVPALQNNFLFNSDLVELDSSLGAYPYESLKKWVSLSNHITEDIVLRCRKLSIVNIIYLYTSLCRVQPPNGYVSSVTQVLPDNPKKLPKKSACEPEGTVKDQSTDWFAGVGYFSSQHNKSHDRHDIPSYGGKLQAKPDSVLR